MRTNIYEYLYLTRQERNGLLVLILSSVFVAFAPAIYSFFEKKGMTDFSKFKNEIEFFIEAETTASPLAVFNNKNQKRKVENFEDTVVELFPFDPNLASKEDFIRLGISQKTAQTILNFRNKGAKFFKKEDFKKVYGLKQSDYERLKNLIRIKKKEKKTLSSAMNDISKSDGLAAVTPTPFDPNTADVNILLQNGIPKHVAATILKYRTKGGIFKTKEDLKKIYTLDENIFAKIEPYIQIAIQEKRTIVKASAARENFPQEDFENENVEIDINQSSAEDWQKLRGIGPSFSKRIVNYRNKLGGFYSINQVGETYGLPDSIFQKIKKQLQPSPILNKINLNQATEDQFKMHPYFSWNQAKVIVSYRNMHGEFKAINDLLKIGALKKEWFEKVKHYLKI